MKQCIDEWGRIQYGFGGTIPTSIDIRGKELQNFTLFLDYQYDGEVLILSLTKEQIDCIAEWANKRKE
jgi:hypothetical protein